MVEGRTDDQFDRPVAFLFGRGSLYSIAHASRMLAMLLVTPLVTRVLSSDQYGTLATATRVGQVAAVIVALGLPGGLARMYFDRGGEQTARRLVGSTFLIAVFVAIVLHLTGPLWAGMFQGLDYSGPLVVAVWMGVPVAVLEAAQAILRNMDDAVGFVIAAIIATAAGQFAGLVTVALGGGPTAYLAAVAVLTACAAMYSAARGRIGTRVASRSQVAAALRLGTPTVPHLLALLVIAVGDRIVVERVLGLGSVARYEISYQIGALLLVVLSAINNAWAPMIYGASDRDRWDVLASTTRALEWCAVPLIGALCFAAPLGVRVLGPSSYDLVGLGSVSAVVAGSTIIYIRYLANVHIVFQVKHTVVLAWSTPIAAVVNIAVAMVLTRHWGLIGSAFATVVAYAVLALLTSLVARRHARVPRDWRSVATTFVAVAALVVAASVLPEVGTLVVVVRTAATVAMLVITFLVVRHVVRES